MKKITRQIHPFHLVDPSPWPILGGFSAMGATSGGVMYMHAYKSGGYLLALGLFGIVLVMAVWWRDIIREATFEGQHTHAVQQGLRWGMALFIVSEIMFFFAFFWAFFWSSCAPAIEIGAIWPPKGITPFNCFEIPLLNTLILLTSGATVTLCHNSMVVGNRKITIYSLAATIFYASIFTGFQAYEYCHATFTISDGIYGSCFYLATGFHGFHVFVGTCFLTVCLVRVINYHFTREHHFGFEAAAWYWHFVDVVWLFLFVAIYWWGGN
jgi:cytochrome c oxidase subunit 3|tara:strand:+ start:1347 stop:2150 length:804 start_codon:yes stop_codon:yes gene_type:complete